MKSFLLFPVIGIFFCSCQTYQYMSLSGVNIKNDSTYRFVMENDTLSLSYDFRGQYGPVKLSIYNKTDKPLFIDWRKSAVIIRDKAYSYYSPDMSINGSSVGTTLDLSRDISAQSANFEAHIKAQEGVDFIPPRSFKERSSVFLATGLLNGISPDLMVKQFPDGNRDLPKLKTIEFNQGSSPFSLRSYLTFYTEDSANRSFNLEHRFYVSRIYEGISGPLNMGNYLDRGDRFYTSEMNGIGKTAGVVSVVGVLTAAALGSNAQQGN